MTYSPTTPEAALANRIAEFFGMDTADIGVRAAAFSTLQGIRADGWDVMRIATAQALSDLIDSIDAIEGFVDLEAGQGGEGSVVRACHVIGKPIPPNLTAWLAATLPEQQP